MAQTVCAATRRKRRGRRKRDEEKEMTAVNTAAVAALPGGKTKPNRGSQGWEECGRRVNASRKGKLEQWRGGWTTCWKTRSGLLGWSEIV